MDDGIVVVGLVLGWLLMFLLGGMIGDCTADAPHAYAEGWCEARGTPIVAAVADGDAPPVCAVVAP